MLKARKSIACCSPLIRRYGILWKWITSVNLQAASTAEKEEALCVAIFHHIQSSLPKKNLIYIRPCMTLKGDRIALA